ncbi:MAG: ATP-binding cassette domain-containing protein [Akkermansiaceae bacterium]|nr:ATP-binding cassette domain-containing protein [Akkermansiaceae bacterium]
MSTVRQPNMIILAGPNGSGKTTFATLLAQHDWGKGCININADDLAQQLGSWDDPICTAQAQLLARKQLELSLHQKQNIIYEIQRKSVAEYGKRNLRATAIGERMRAEFPSPEP